MTDEESYQEEQEQEMSSTSSSRRRRSEDLLESSAFTGQIRLSKHRCAWTSLHTAKIWIAERLLSISFCEGDDRSLWYELPPYTSMNSFFSPTMAVRYVKPLSAELPLTNEERKAVSKAFFEEGAEPWFSSLD